LGADVSPKISNDMRIVFADRGGHDFARAVRKCLSSKLCAILRKALTIHPAFRLDLREPILCRGNAPQVFPYMLFPDVTHWNLSAFAVGDRDPEKAFAREDSFGVMPKRAMTEIREECFGLIKPGCGSADSPRPCRQNFPRCFSHV
jgi:hypothetical protein